MEGESSAWEGDFDSAKRSEVEAPCEERQGVWDNSTDAESTSAQAASANETGLHEIANTADSETASKAEGSEGDRKTEESAAESSEVKESSVEGDDQKKRFVVFCLLEQWLLQSVTLAPLLTSLGALGRCNGLRISSLIVFLFHPHFPSPFV